MGLLDPDRGLEDLSRARTEVRRTVDRLRSMPIAKLERRRPQSTERDDATDAGGTPATRAFALAAVLADEAADLDSRPRRPLPSLPAASAGDVLAVCAHDLMAVLEAAPDPAATARLSEAMITLRRSL